MASKKTGGAFGRDEMNLLLGVAGGDEAKAGIGTAGTALLQSRGVETNSQQRSKGKKKEGIDFSTLSTAETAALIQQEQLSKGAKSTAHATSSRHRAQPIRSKKRLAHHELLEQELLAQQQQQQQQHQQLQQKEQQQQQQSESEDETEFAANKKKGQSSNTGKRIQLEPQIVAQKDAPRRQRQQRRRSSSSESSNDGNERIQRKRQVRKEASSSSSDESSTANRRRPRRSPSSSSSSSSEDERRQRRLQKRQQLEAKTEAEMKQNDIKETTVDLDNRKTEKPTIEKPKPARERGIKLEESTAPSRKKQQKKSSSSGSSSSSSSEDGSSSDSSDSSSSSEEEPVPVLAKPLFVPKRKRLQLEQEKIEAERAEREREETAKKLKQKRKMESRALVAQVVSTGASAAANDDGMVSEDEEALAERMLDDKDAEDEEKERDLWEVRELGRLLEEIDRLKKKEREEAEYRRRQQLTDEQAQAEDMASGRYQQPGSSRMQSGDKKDEAKYTQKYFHRGAYYMDEEEFEEGDVRLRAKEYEMGVTESAKSRGDTRKLPQVMQVKQFGRANQSKYQGLAKEDTSNKESSTILPLVHHKHPQQQGKTDIHRHKAKK